MIRDLGLTLQALLLHSAPAPLSAAQVAFDRPGDAYSPSQTTINLFLFDIRENLALRSNEPEIERNGLSATIRRPVRRVECSYLVTAWPIGGADPPLQEHQLLGQVIQVLSRYPLIPSTLAVGDLKSVEPLVPLQVAITEGPAAVADFWTALGLKLRAAVVARATVPLTVFADETQVTARAHEVRIGQSGSSGHETSITVAGRVLLSDGKPAVGAVVTVTIAGALLRAKADDKGRYQLGPLKAGTHQFRAEKDALSGQIDRDVPPPTAATNYDLTVS